jgi:hypothetical protein
MTINPLYFFSLQIGDPTGEATAQMNLADLRRTLGVDGDGGCGGMGNSTKGHASEADDDGLYGADSKARRRLSMERMDLLKVCLCLAAFVALLFFFGSSLLFFRIVPHPWSLPLFIITTPGRWEFYWKPSKTYHYQFYFLA